MQRYIGNTMFLANSISFQLWKRIRMKKKTYLRLKLMTVKCMSTYIHIRAYISLKSLYIGQINTKNSSQVSYASYNSLKLAICSKIILKINKIKCPIFTPQNCRCPIFTPQLSHFYPILKF